MWLFFSCDPGQIHCAPQLGYNFYPQIKFLATPLEDMQHTWRRSWTGVSWSTAWRENIAAGEWASNYGSCHPPLCWQGRRPGLTPAEIWRRRPRESRPSDADSGVLPLADARQGCRAHHSNRCGSWRRSVQSTRKNCKAKYTMYL